MPEVASRTMRRSRSRLAHCLVIHLRSLSRSLLNSVNLSAMHSTRCLNRGPVRYA